MKKLGLIILVVIMALGVMGAGYAAWSQNMTVNATVIDATFNVRFNGSDGTTNGSYGFNYVVSGNGTETLAITINNVYPDATFNIPFTVGNFSTIPVNAYVTGNTSWVSAAGPGVLAANTSGNGNIQIVTDNTFASGATYTFYVNLTAVQYTP